MASEAHTALKHIVEEARSEIESSWTIVTENDDIAQGITQYAFNRVEEELEKRADEFNKDAKKWIDWLGRMEDVHNDEEDEKG